MNELMKVEDFFQNVHEGSDANIDTSTIQETYFQSLDLESNYDENDGGEEILDTWEDLEIGGEVRIDIEAPNSTLNFFH